MKKLIALGAVCAIAGCGADKSREDAHDLKATCNGPEDVRLCVDKTPKRVVGFHNNFSNVAESCDGHGHRLFVTTAEKLAVMTDPTCAGYVKQPGQAVTAP